VGFSSPKAFQQLKLCIETPIPGFRNGVAAIRFDNGAGQSFEVVGLRTLAKCLIVKVITPLENESLEDIFNSFNRAVEQSGTRVPLTHFQNARGRNWKNCADRIVWEGPEGIGNNSIA
jgi:hypothetical protein